MKTIKLLALVALVALLSTGCAGLMQDEPEDACEVTQMGETAAPAAVPSYSDAAVTEAPAVVEPEVVPVAAPVLQNINFDFDQHLLSEQARAILDENARYLQINNTASVVVSGYCDERGSDEYNLALGERRAIAAANYLVSMGISPQRISTISYGEEKPLDPASTEAAWAMNRRAEFTPQF
ncbi:MAG: peptidoglycan-associated lipoprotein Pal [Desulfuromonas sp.]|nr:peptidoglycan-associated lipoprotein Pal [Desulfuromonas sp.]